MELGRIEEYYFDGRRYDVENDDYALDIPFYVERAKRSGGPVLEVGCGTGRVTLPIAREGLEIVGLDIAPAMLARLGDKAAKEGLEIPLVEADCRHFSLDRLFELIICPFSAMQHMHDRASLEAFLDRVRAHLTPGAPFIFDVFNPNVEVLARGAGERFPVFTYTEEESGQEIFVEEATDYDDAAQVSHITWYCTGGGSDEVREEEIHLRCFYPQELDMLLYYNRFEILDKLGTFSGEPFASGLGRQIVVCRPV
ncbi:MAG TPA: class I SAM-dependent methyltransferase [Candidatus Hydrogenedentes bacterium]|nr:class I SAM-dependent methyltransferase [Candidatus Hydrogenedentota bacterium]